MLDDFLSSRRVEPSSDDDVFRTEVVRGGRARPDDLPQQHVGVADALLAWFGEIVGVQRLVGDRPGASAVHPLGHDHEPGLQVRRAQSRVHEVGVLQRFLQRCVAELRDERADSEERLLEDISRQGHVQALQLLGVNPEREDSGDDRAGRCSADEIEVVRQNERRVAVLLAQQPLNRFQILQRENPTDAAAIERQDALRKHTRIEVLCQRTGHR